MQSRVSSLGFRQSLWGVLLLSPSIRDGKLTWSVPAGRWKVMKFTHQQDPGLGQGGGKEMSVDRISRDCVEWFLQTVYQPHYEHFNADYRLPM